MIARRWGSRRGTCSRPRCPTWPACRSAWPGQCSASPSTWLCAPFGRLPGWGNLVLLVRGVARRSTPRWRCWPSRSRWRAAPCCTSSACPSCASAWRSIVRADIGVGPLEMVMLVATDRSVSRWCGPGWLIEVTTLAVGGLLGGALGLGTAGFALAAGPLIAGWLRLLRWRRTSAAVAPRPPVGAGHDVPEPRNSSPATGRLRSTANAATPRRRRRAPTGAGVAAGRPGPPAGRSNHGGVGVQRQQHGQQQVVVEGGGDVAVEQVVGAAQAAAGGAVEAEQHPAGAGRVRPVPVAGSTRPT